MKKMLMSVMALALSMAAMATQTAYVEVTLTGESGLSSVVRLTQDDARNADFEDGYDTDKVMMYSNTRSVLIYGIVGTHKCEDVVTNDLTNLAVGFSTNQIDQNYTISFANYSGAELKLYDKVTETETVISNSATYDFSVTPAQVGRKLINDRFVINFAAPTLDVCFKDNHIEVLNNPFSDVNITLERVDETDFPGTKSFVGTTTDIDMTNDTNYPAGRYYVKFAGGNRKFIIVKP